MSDQFLSERLRDIQRQKRQRTFTFTAIIIGILLSMIGLSRIGFFSDQVSSLNTMLAPTQTITRTQTQTATSTPLPPTLTPVPSSTYTNTPIPPVRGVALGDVYVRDYPIAGSVFLTLQEGEDVLVIGYWGDPETGWYKVDFGAKDGWVVREMIKVIGELPREFEILSLP